DLKQEMANRKTHLRAAREGVTRACLTAMVNLKGHPQSMTEAGMQLRRPWQKAGVPGAPQNLRARATANAGEVRLDWKRPLRRCLFEVQRTTNPLDANSWQLCDTGGQQRAVESDLVSGRQYYF